MKLLQYWMREQGAITRGSRQPVKQSALQQSKSALERLTEMQHQMQEQMMHTRMLDQMEALEEKQERREERQERRQVAREQRELFTQPHQTSIQPFALPSSLPLSAPLPLSALPFSPYSYPQPVGKMAEVMKLPPSRQDSNDERPKSSSPIDIEEDDIDTLTAFFNWKTNTTKNPERMQKWEQTKQIVLANDWTIQELQHMEDGTCAMYQRAKKAGISDGFARGFRVELRKFKEQYRRLRDEAKAAWALNQLQGLGGGFMPAN
jgi:hypothetical protein